MAAQITGDPIIKITLTDNNLFDDVAPGYVCESFMLNKGLLRPNKFVFTLRKESLAVESSDLTFELRDKLLTAKVEVNLNAAREENAGELIPYEVEDFFYGYIQNIKIFRVNGGAVKFRCTAYSPDAKLKQYPTNRSFNDYTLKECVEEVLKYDSIEPMVSYDVKKGKYSDNVQPLNADINIDNNENVPIPYTVQYRESHYNFLKRLARRYAKYMYYENRKFVFGEMNELPEITMKNGADIEEYTYEMNMNDHNGIAFTELAKQARYIIQEWGFEKKNEMTENIDESYFIGQYDDTDEYENEMAKSVYNSASNFYGDTRDSVTELCASPINNGKYQDLESYYGSWNVGQRDNLNYYVMADSLICTGKLARLDVKLGTVINIVDENKTGQEKEDVVTQQPLKVIDLLYIWNKEKDAVESRFKAIPKDTKVPPYLERDKDGFLLYGDFDLYPHCGPQHGVVIENDDPEHLGRVKVMLLWQEVNGYLENNSSYKYLEDKHHITPWIWVSNSYQGGNVGSLVIPERGHYVLVGFEHNNAECPYVIGNVFMRDCMPEEWRNFKNNVLKGFATRSGHTIEIIDKEGDSVDNADRKYNVGGKIRIYDRCTHSYDLTFDADKNLIRIESKGNIELTAGKDIVLHAKNDVTINADHNMDTVVMNDCYTHVGESEEHYVKNFSAEVEENFDVNAGNMFWVNVASGGSVFRGFSDGVGIYYHIDGEDVSSAKAGMYANKDLTLVFSKETPVCMIAEGSNGKAGIKADITVALESGGELKTKSTGQTTITGNPVKING